jgi:sugar phosphate permease
MTLKRALEIVISTLAIIVIFSVIVIFGQWPEAISLLMVLILGFIGAVLFGPKLKSKQF